MLHFLVVKPENDEIYIEIRDSDDRYYGDIVWFSDTRLAGYRLVVHQDVQCLFGAAEVEEISNFMKFLNKGAEDTTWVGTFIAKAPNY